jgi:hypothetical protein
MRKTVPAGGYFRHFFCHNYHSSSVEGGHLVVNEANRSHSLTVFGQFIEELEF